MRGYNSPSVIKPRVNSVQTQDENAQAPDKLSTLVKTLKKNVFNYQILNGVVENQKGQLLSASTVTN